ncbi:unnamed protein product [Gongylonema pulchrum]|uniref:DUF4704 domain-containing protein n=1 Tax=Gongylonema pulchrum TaxID=637853 RepID=A0A183E5H8_9BILA|nr:unnamed protein product [Gongylonema pulchrum]
MLINCELIAGPYHCADYTDAYGHLATIQIPGRIFAQQPARRGGGGRGFKSVVYYLVLRAMSDLSVDQTVTLLKISDREKSKSNEKQILLETADLHNNLVMLAAGIVLRTSGAQKTCTMGEKLQQQNLALDVIEWLIDNWVYTSAHKNLLNLAEMIIENVDAIFANCFVASPRTIAHKWSAKLIYLLRTVSNADECVYSKLLYVLLSCSTRIVISLHAVKSAGSLHWFSVFIFSLLKVMYDWSSTVLSLWPRAPSKSSECMISD